MILLGRLINKDIFCVGQDSQGTIGDGVRVLAVGCCLLCRSTISLYVVEEVAAKSSRPWTSSLALTKTSSPKPF